MKKCTYPFCEEKAEGPRWEPVLCRKHFVEMLAVVSKAFGPDICIFCGDRNRVTVHHMVATRDHHSSIDGEADLAVCAECLRKMKLQPSFLEQKGKA